MRKLHFWERARSVIEISFSFDYYAHIYLNLYNFILQFATVYKARNVETDELVAVKKVRRYIRLAVQSVQFLISIRTLFRLKSAVFKKRKMESIEQLFVKLNCYKRLNIQISSGC